MEVLVLEILVAGLLIMRFLDSKKFSTSEDGLASANAKLIHLRSYVRETAEHAVVIDKKTEDLSQSLARQADNMGDEKFATESALKSVHETLISQQQVFDRFLAIVEAMSDKQQVKNNAKKQAKKVRRGK